MATKRIEALEALADHPWFSRIWSRLSAEDLAMMRAWAREHAELDAAAWEMAVNRMFLDRSRPRRWREIMEMLTVAGTSARD